jgi:pyruvate/2-oxoglutarate dehydrogenase complex dihydrolipoamide dehydrogenase (E3) component
MYGDKRESVLSREHDDWAHPANARPDGWRNPEPPERYHFVILGGGPVGILAARMAAKLGAKVALIERNLLGGTCLNTGCISSKAIIRTSRLYADMRDAERFGGQAPREMNVEFSGVMERIHRILARLGRRASAQQLGAMGVDVYFGAASFAGPDVVGVDGTPLRFKKALIATGARPKIPSIPGLTEAGCLTNENVFDLTECPRRLLVIGGGPLGCELAQAFSRLGSQVIIVQDEPMFLSQEERDAAQLLSEAFTEDGIQVHLNTDVVSVHLDGNQKVAELVTDDYRQTVVADEILMGTGRTPNVDGLNLEAAGVEYDTGSGVRVNDFLQTTNRRIYAAGDICAGRRFTHIEEAWARMVVRNALFWGRQRLSALTNPWCIYTDPEIAHAGLYVTEALEKNIPVKTFTILMHDVDRAIADGEEDGFVKIHVKEGTDTILGATVVARHAGEMINHISLAMASGIGMRTLSQINYPYPTQAMAIKMAADAYNSTRLSPAVQWLLRKWLSL